MNVQPLTKEFLCDAQRLAKELFPWETEHQMALAMAIDPQVHQGFLNARGLVSVRCWTVHPAGPQAVSGLASLYCYSTDPEDVWLAWFGLAPEVRGNGGGRKLLDWLIQLAREEGRRTLRLWTTDEPEYARATALYARRGFSAEPHPALPGEDWQTLVFSLPLDGRPLIPWVSIAERRELCGRVAPAIAVAA